MNNGWGPQHCNTGCTPSQTVYRQGPRGPTGATGLRGFQGVIGPPESVPNGIIEGVWSGPWGDNTYTREISYTLFNNVCFVSFSEVVSNVTSNTGLISYSGIVPAGFRPAEDVYAIVSCLASSNVRSGQLIIDINGNILVNFTLSDGSTGGILTNTVKYKIA